MSKKEKETPEQLVKYHRMLMRALIPLLPNSDKKHAHEWLNKLHRTDGSKQQLKNRAEYLWFFIMMATQGHGMLPPFDKSPNKGSLISLSSFLPRELYNEVTECPDRNSWWKDEQLMEGLEDKDLEDDDQPWMITPNDFYNNQPLPYKNGCYAYACAFAPHQVSEK